MLQPRPGSGNIASVASSEYELLSAIEMNSMSDSLPVPPLAARKHSEQLTAEIRREIDEAGGAIGFSDFMALALYRPGMGYYSAGSRKFGAAGDFVTAPELGPLYGRCLARWLAAKMAKAETIEMLELGAGSGVLAADLLHELDLLGRLPRRYLILEVSADLRNRQQAYLRSRGARWIDRVQWLDAWPESFDGVVLGNEVVDALPFERFEIATDGPVALGVHWEDGRFREIRMPPSEDLRRRVEEIESRAGGRLPAGFRSEFCPMLEPWMASLSCALKRGIVLLADYGLPRHELYHPSRSEGTLRCHYRHRAHDDPFVLVGLQDITAWVDFTALADAGIGSGLQLDGFASQAHFLLESGMSEILADEAGEGRLAMHEQARRLLLPGEMGERFKMMVFSRDWPGQPAGFQKHDMRHRL